MEIEIEMSQEDGEAIPLDSLGQTADSKAPLIGLSGDESASPLSTSKLKQSQRERQSHRPAQNARDVRI